MSGRITARIIAGLGLVLLAGCSGKDDAARRQADVVPVTTQVVQTSAWSDTLQALGTAKARESVTITAKVSEIIETVHFDSGQQVSAGTPLVTLRGQAQEAALLQAQATFAEADQLYKRQRELAAQQLVASATLDTQRAIRDAAEARVREMQSDIGDRRVRAPFAGVLGIRQVSEGTLVTPTTVIATLDDIERMHVDFQVPEAELASLAKGDKVSATSVAYPGRTFEGDVATIDTRVDPGTRAVTVRADFINADHALRPGMLLDVRMFRPERQALVIPEIAVVQVGRDSFVFRVKPDHTVERVDVVTGARRSGVVEIREGLKAGERIVVDGTGKLRPGLKVDDSTAPAAAPASPATTPATSPADAPAEKATDPAPAGSPRAPAGATTTVAPAGNAG
ncbi:efflux RND transporter periplasmic adaptor subunit [Stenotrophomonas sp. ISL-67]|uniref:efflux RND transporter periplasmic adaptor subunit n=1 Tax=Stenotrophomonas sp. ISL-67 TaxID=2819171 RepID=UPI001BEB4C65|nr:efflux RND transporter periplasmic adaptor subunit [Stenotrophomonas sp. ISL-67]MBT2766763.1 efflux RND transporter periplasmic adaptor subunit [Stenotrophomonas sp. ISL-67]